MNRKTNKTQTPQKSTRTIAFNPAARKWQEVEEGHKGGIKQYWLQRPRWSGWVCIPDND